MPLPQLLSTPQPPPPLPGTEEYRQRNIEQTSAFIKQQLNIETDNFSTDTLCERNLVQQESNIVQDTKEPTASTSITVVNNKPKSKKSSSPSTATPTIDIKEIHQKIINYISSLSHQKKVDFVNRSYTAYDPAIEYIQKQKKLELSRKLRELSKENAVLTDSDALFSIIPDMDIKIEDLPKEMMKQLSNILDEDVNEMLHCRENEAIVNNDHVDTFGDMFTDFPNVREEEELDDSRKPVEIKSQFEEVSEWDNLPKPSNIKRKIKLRRLKGNNDVNIETNDCIQPIVINEEVKDTKKVEKPILEPGTSLHDEAQPDNIEQLALSPILSLRRVPYTCKKLTKNNTKNLSSDSYIDEVLDYEPSDTEIKDERGKIIDTEITDEQHKSIDAEINDEKHKSTDVDKNNDSSKSEKKESEDKLPDIIPIEEAHNSNVPNMCTVDETDGVTNNIVQNIHSHCQNVIVEKLEQYEVPCDQGAQNISNVSVGNIKIKFINQKKGRAKKSVKQIVKKRAKTNISQSVEKYVVQQSEKTEVPIKEPSTLDKTLPENNLENKNHNEENISLKTDVNLDESPGDQIQQNNVDIKDDENLQETKNENLQEVKDENLQTIQNENMQTIKDQIKDSERSNNDKKNNRKESFLSQKHTTSENLKSKIPETKTNIKEDKKKEKPTKGKKPLHKIRLNAILKIKNSLIINKKSSHLSKKSPASNKREVEANLEETKIKTEETTINTEEITVPGSSNKKNSNTIEKNVPYQMTSVSNGTHTIESGKSMKGKKRRQSSLENNTLDHIRLKLQKSSKSKKFQLENDNNIPSVSLIKTEINSSPIPFSHNHSVDFKPIEESPLSMNTINGNSASTSYVEQDKIGVKTEEQEFTSQKRHKKRKSSSKSTKFNSSESADNVVVTAQTETRTNESECEDSFIMTPLDMDIPTSPRKIVRLVQKIEADIQKLNTFKHSLLERLSTVLNESSAKKKSNINDKSTVSKNNKSGKKRKDENDDLNREQINKVKEEEEHLVATSENEHNVPYDGNEEKNVKKNRDSILVSIMPIITPCTVNLVRYDLTDSP